jgi:glycosyl transferase family 25
MSNIPIFVINLAHSSERLAFISKQLNSINKSFERIDAIDGSKMASDKIQEYQKKSKTNLHYAVLNEGEIGCSISWQNVWKEVANHTSDACVVLEDDVKLHNNFESVISALFNDIDEDIVIDLSGKKGFFIKEKKTINGIKLVRYQTPPLKNQGGIYGRNAAKNLVDKISNFSAPIDTLRQMLWLHDVQTWSLEEGCLSHHSQDVGGSTIQSRRKTLTERLKKELIRPLWRLYIIIKNFLYQ